MNDLDSLFKDFNTRKGLEQNDDRQQRAREERLRSQSIEVLKNTVLPALTNLSKSIQEKGYKSQIMEMFENYSYPSVEFSFTPSFRRADSFTHLSPSRLSFSHSKTGWIKITKEIRGRDERLSPAQFGNYLNKDTTKITEAQVRESAVNFIKEVLAAN